MFTDHEKEIFEAALEGDPEPTRLVDAYRILAPELVDLQPDGWQIQGADLIPLVAGLYDQVERLKDEKIASASYDDGKEASDEAILAELGPGVIYDADPRGERLYRSDLIRELHELREQVRQAESAAGVIVGHDEDGEPVYTIIS